MRSGFVALLAPAAVAASSVPSFAADGCGRGRFNNGYRCVPMRYDPEIRAVPRFYDGPRYHRRGGWNTYNGCPPRYTIQDGVCKPYRGY